jgi:hypothetical protein
MSNWDLQFATNEMARVTGNLAAAYHRTLIERDEAKAEIARLRAALLLVKEACRANLVYAGWKDEIALLRAFEAAEAALASLSDAEEEEPLSAAEAHRLAEARAHPGRGILLEDLEVEFRNPSTPKEDPNAH